MNECVHTITTSLHKTVIFWPGGVQSGLGYFAKLYPGLIWARVNLACYTGTDRYLNVDVDACTTRNLNIRELIIKCLLEVVSNVC